MRTSKLAIASLAFSLFAAPAIAKPFTDLWVFGDSSVDSGSFRVAPYSGDSYVDFYLAPTERRGRTGFEKWGIGKPTSSPGPMNSEELATLLGIAASPQNQGGTNYAFSGARNAIPNTPCLVSNCGFPNAIPTTQQIVNFLKRHKPNKTELFYVSSGGNDVTYAVNEIIESPTPPPNTCGPNAQTYLTTAAQALADAINSLQQHGAKYIMVADRGASSAEFDLGRLQDILPNYDLQRPCSARCSLRAWWQGLQPFDPVRTLDIRHRSQRGPGMHPRTSAHQFRLCAGVFPEVARNARFGAIADHVLGGR